jgi:hypothetical protein
VAEQEKTAAALVGQHLTAVAYFTIDVEGCQPTWHGPGGDSVDFGVDLDFDGHPYSVGWILPSRDTESLQVMRTGLLGWRDLHAKRVEVSNWSRWSPALGARLSAVRLDWRPCSPDDPTSYLVGVHLHFENQQKVTLALADVVRGKIVVSATNVAVIFDDVAVP